MARLARSQTVRGAGKIDPLLKNSLADSGALTGIGLDWPIWLAVGGFILFCLLAFSATLLFVSGTRLSARFRFLQVPTLRERLLAGFVLAATLPAISIALVLIERAAEKRLTDAAITLTARAEALANLAEIRDAAELARVYDRTARGNGMSLVMLDATGQIMFASANSGFASRDQLVGHALLDGLTSPAGEVFGFEQSVGTAEQSERFIATSRSMSNDWHLFLYRPLAEIERVMLSDYAVSLTWLAGTLLISVFLGLTLLRSLSGPLATLHKSVRDFDLNLKQPVPPVPVDSPPEVRAIFESLASLDGGLRTTYRQLRKSVQEGEKVRGEMIYVIANREKEIGERTEALKQANATLKRLSREDSLTGLANRRWFAEFLARAWQNAMREKLPLSILIIDIDDFKAYNDTYGHHEGDQCLKLVAEAIRRAVGRASDLVSRYGGEEFIVVLGDTPLDGGLKIAERIRATVEALGIPHAGATQHDCVTISVGITSTLPTRDTQPETVLVSADRAMYNAKRDGKNRVAYSTSARTGTYQALCTPGNVSTRLS